MNFFRDNKNIIIISLITVLFVSSMIASTVGKPNAGIVSNTIGVVLRPFQSVGTYIINCFKYGADADKFATENTLLKQQLKKRPTMTSLPPKMRSCVPCLN